MKLNPRQAPLYGSCVLTVQLDDEELCEEEDVELFLLFTGSTQRHISSTLRVGHDTLRAVCPAHDCCESVVVSLCSAGPGDHVRLLSSDVVRFSFIQDLAFDMAQFLVGAAGRTDTLEEALLLDEHQIPLQECEKMDQSLALALSHLTLPPGWSLLGSSSTAEPQETLLHFAARRGLHRVVRFLLKQPGAKEALTLPNKQGSTATNLAESRGHQALLALLTREETGTQHSNETHRQICSAPWVVQHHPSLNTYTLSAGTGPGTEPRSLQEDVQDFRRLVLKHSRGEGGAVHQFQSEHADGPEPCSEPPQPSTLDTGEPSSTPTCAKANTVEDVGCAEPLVPRSEGDGDPCSNSAAPAPSSDNGDDDERRACSCENTDCSGENVAACVEGTEQLGDSSDGSQSRPEAEKTACRSTSCGKEPEETDRAQDLICEAQGSAEGPNGEAQEEECSSAKTGRDEEPAQDKELSELGTTAEDMGITQSLDALESSDLDSLSQGSEESSDKVEDGVSEAEEETDGVSEELVAANAEMDQTSCENSETCTSLSCVVDTEISLEDIQEVAFQFSGQETEQLEFEVESNEPEHSIKDKAEGQTQDGQMDLTESSPVQACHNDKGSDQPSQNRDIENNTVEEANEHSTISNTDADQAQSCGSVEQSDSSLVTLNATTESSSHLLEQPEESVNQEQVTTREPELVEESATTGGSESEGLGFESSADVLQLEITSLSESPTLTSEDTLEPEEHESSEIPQEVSCDDQEQDTLCDLQQLEEDQTLLVTSSEGPENSKPPERHDSLESRAVEVILKYEDAQQTAEMEAIPPECSESVPEADGGATSQNSEADQSEEKVEFVETETTKSCQTDTEEEVKALDDDVVVSDSVSVSLDAENIAEISLSVEEPSSVDEVRNMDVSQPDVMDTDSEDTGLGDAQSTKKAEDEEQTSGVEASLEDQEDFQTEKCPEVSTDNEQVPTIHRERDSLCVDSTQDPTLGGPPEKRQSSESAETPQSQVRHSTGSATLRDSGSDTDGFLSTDTGEDNVFRKVDEAIGAGDSTSEVSVSCSSTDDTASLGHPSSSAESSEEARRGEGGGGNVGGEAEEEAKDLLTEVPRRSSVLRSTVRSLSPFRRHSWGPGKNQGAEGDMNQRSSVRSVVGDKKPVFHRRSYSLEGLAAERDDGKGWRAQSGGPSHGQRGGRAQRGDDRGSQVSLNEAGLESDLGDQSSLDSQKSRRFRSIRRNCPSMTLPLRESVSMLSISNRDIDGMKSFTSTSSSLGYSITEEEPGPLRGDFEGKSGTKMSRTFSYLKNKMYKKTREKDKEKSREKDAKDKEKKAVNGHLFSPVISLPSTLCQHCNKALGSKEAVSCAGCNVCVHKSCRENIPSCSKTKQFLIPESTTMPGVTLRTKTSSMPRERPWSAVLSPDDLPTVTAPRRHTSIMPFNNSNLSKSVSISNISVFDEMSIKGFKYLSQSTDSLHKANKVNESTESLIDEGTELNDGQLMAEFEPDAKELEADSWSFTVDKKYLKQLKKDAIKKQDVIYELIQTEFHHVRTLRIMADVYSKGLLKEVQLETQTVEKIFPVLDELLELHMRFLHGLLERKREAKQEGSDGGFVISRIGDLLMGQFSGTKAENLKKVYGKFCSRHNEAVNLYKELHAKDKRFQTFIRKKMSSSVVRRLGIPECILLVTQRITKYPVLMQRILQHTKENDEDYEDLAQALQLVKEVIAAVDSKVNEHEKRRRLKDIYSRTDGKSIMRMKSGQMFAREDLIRGRKLLHDGPLQLKTSTGRLKDVQALLLSDVLVFLQEKDQKYVFASLDQRATVISLQKLIVREVANEDRGLFLIAAGIERPEMVEVHACSRDERNTWIQLIHDAMQSIEKDEDEGIPSETEEDKRLLESKAKKMRDMLQRKDDQIVALLLEKMKLFHDMCESDENGSASKMLFRACSDDKGEPIMKQAIKEVEMLQTLVSSSLGGAVGQQVVSAPGNISANAANVSLPRRAETFGGFDSHQMNISKTGDKDEGEDLRRTESDGVLKKGGNTNLQHLLKRNREQVLTSVTHLHDLLNSLQAVVLQQDTAIEDQRQSLSERPSSRPPSRPSSRPPSLVEQEKQRSLERQRQEAAALQRQQNAHAEERRRREREWEAREKELAERELLLHSKEEEAQKSWQELEEVRRELAGRKDDYQKDLERLRDSQRRLERDREQVQREMETLECLRETEKRVNRTPSSTSEDSLNVQSPGSLERDATETELSSSPRKNSLTRIDSKHKGRNLNPFSLGPKALSTEAQKQMPSRLLQLTRTKDKKEKKKKKSKSKAAQEAESHLLPLTEPPLDGEIFFC